MARHGLARSSAWGRTGLCCSRKQGELRCMPPSHSPGILNAPAGFYHPQYPRVAQGFSLFEPSRSPCCCRDGSGWAPTRPSRARFIPLPFPMTHCATCRPARSSTTSSKEPLPASLAGCHGRAVRARSCWRGVSSRPATARVTSTPMNHGTRCCRWATGSRASPGCRIAGACVTPWAGCSRPT